MKSLQWFNENSDDNHNVIFADGWYFTESMSFFCGEELIIEKISHATNPPYYMMKDNMFAWTDEMLEGLAEESLDNDMKEHQRMCDEIMDIQGIEPIEAEMEQIIHCPEGYIFKDENGNVINATKIVLEKKGKEYPKTYEECIGKLPINWDGKVEGYKCDLLTTFQKLLICRDAYWKIAGEEMGLGKSWSPSDNNKKPIHAITRYDGYIIKDESGGNDEVLEFPTENMRDAFYENFKKEIEICKELL